MNSHPLLELSLLLSSLPQGLASKLQQSKLEILADRSLCIEVSNFSEAAEIKQSFQTLAAAILNPRCPIGVDRVIFRWPFGQWILPVNLAILRIKDPRSRS